MKEIRYFYCPDAAKCNELPKEEAEHAIRVLRLQPDDIIHITDGNGTLYEAEIESISKKNCSFRIISQHKEKPYWKGEIHLAVAPTKNIDRMEWLVEKATEIGFNGIHFLNCQFSERKAVNIERMERIAISAMKQSHKVFLPQVSALESFAQFVSRDFDGNKCIAHCYDDADFQDTAGKQYLPQLLEESKAANSVVLIGPEGDFSVPEVKMAIEKSFAPITLGESRLRTETAALLAVIMMNMNNVKL